MDNVESIKKNKPSAWKQLVNYAKANPEETVLVAIWGVIGLSFAGFLLYVGKSVHGHEVVQTDIWLKDDVVVLSSFTKNGKEFVTTYTKEAAKDVIKAAITAADAEVLREVAEAID